VGSSEYEGKNGFFEVSYDHAAVLQKFPFNFSLVSLDAEDHKDDDEADEVDFSRMSKAELIEFIRDRDGDADRKMSKEQLVEIATGLKDAVSEEE